MTPNDAARWKSPPSEGPSRPRFCVLEYTRNAPDPTAFRSGAAVLIAIYTEVDPASLTLQVDRNWEQIVAPEDRPLVKALLADFRLRALEDPSELFRQISSLDAGPLVTRGSGAQTLAIEPTPNPFAEFIEL